MWSHHMQVLRNKPDFRRKPWPTISNAAKDFVKKLLVKDPRARLTAAQALCMFPPTYFLLGEGCLSHYLVSFLKIITFIAASNLGCSIILNGELDCKLCILLYSVRQSLIFLKKKREFKHMKIYFISNSEFKCSIIFHKNWSILF